VDEHRVRPRSALDVVAVARPQHDAEPADVDALGGAVRDRPGERAVANPVRRASAEPAVDPAARARSIAVARFEVGAAHVIRHLRQPIPIVGTCRPGTEPGAAATQIPRATKATAETRANRSPCGRTFCTRTISATAAIQIRLITPSANRATIKPEQQPTQ